MPATPSNSPKEQSENLFSETQACTEDTANNLDQLGTTFTLPSPTPNPYLPLCVNPNLEQENNKRDDKRRAELAKTWSKQELEVGGKRVREYRIEKGDVLGTISKKFTVSVSSLVKFNGLPNAEDINAGHILYIPPLGYQVTEKFIPSSPREIASEQDSEEYREFLNLTWKKMQSERQNLPDFKKEGFDRNKVVSLMKQNNFEGARDNFLNKLEPSELQQWASSLDDQDLVQLTRYRGRRNYFVNKGITIPFSPNNIAQELETNASLKKKYSLGSDAKAQIESLSPDQLSAWLSNLEPKQISLLKKSSSFIDDMVKKIEYIKADPNWVREQAQDVLTHFKNNKGWDSRFFDLFDSTMVTKLISQESTFEVYAASGSGSLGLGQATAWSYNNNNSESPDFNPFDPTAAIEGVITHLYLEGYERARDNRMLSKINDNTLNTAVVLDVYNKGIISARSFMRNRSKYLKEIVSSNAAYYDSEKNPSNYAYKVLNQEPNFKQ